MSNTPDPIPTGSNEGKMPDGPAPWDLPPSSLPERKGTDVDALTNQANEILPIIENNAQQGVKPDLMSIITLLKAGMFDKDIANRTNKLDDTLNKDET